MKEFFGKAIRGLQRFSERWWYMPVLVALAAADAFVFVISTEVLMLSAVFAKPKRWLSTAFWFTLGSSMGATALALVTEIYGQVWVSHFFPHLLTSSSWIKTTTLVQEDGFWGLALVSFSPFPQHAAVVIAGLARMGIPKVFAAVFLGRGLKYSLLCWLGVHSPKLVKRFTVKRVKKNGGPGGTKAST